MSTSVRALNQTTPYWEAACGDFFSHTSDVHSVIQYPQPGHQRRKVDDREHTTGAEGPHEARVDRRRVSQMVVDTAKDNRIAAILRQVRIVGLRLHERDIRQPRGGNRCSDLLEVEIVRVHAPVRADLGRERRRQFAVAGADVGDRHARLQGKNGPQSRQFSSVGAESRPAPRAQAGGHDHQRHDERSDDGGNREPDPRPPR